MGERINSPIRATITNLVFAIRSVGGGGAMGCVTPA
jgi:hypothetical protein